MTKEEAIRCHKGKIIVRFQEQKNQYYITAFNVAWARVKTKEEAEWIYSPILVDLDKRNSSIQCRLEDIERW